MLKDILKMLYKGEIKPDEREMLIHETLIEKRRQYARHESALLEELDEQLREKIEAVFEESEALFAHELEDAYVRGMRMGAQLTAALLLDKKDLPTLT